MHTALLYEQLDNKEVQCKLCSHYCLIENNHKGKCGVRINKDGKLFSLTFKNASGFAIDPIEKKPFFHFRPGTKVLSFGTPGCNFKCKNCQNSDLSFCDTKQLEGQYKYDSDYILNLKNQYDFDGIAYTYSEPTIFFEYARDVILKAKSNELTKDLYHVFISNGFMSDELIDLIISEELIQAINIDLKFMSNESYENICKGKLEPVLNSIERLGSSSLNIHLEIINLVILGLNDSDSDFELICDFISKVNSAIPIHFNKFYPRNQMLDYPTTSNKQLLRAKEIAEKYSLHHIYIGNTNMDSVNNSYCPNCKSLVIERGLHGIKSNSIVGTSRKCPYCEHKINIVL